MTAYKPDKHGRDHCYGGEDPIPCLRPPWIVLWDGARQAADNTWVDVPFNEATWDPTLTSPSTPASPGDPGKGRPFELTEITIEGGAHYVLKTWRAGWYRYHSKILWDQVATPGNDVGYAVSRMFLSSFATFTNDNDQRAAADWNSTNYLDGNFEMLDNPWIKDSDTLFIPGPRTWNFHAKQVTGDTRGLSGDYMKVWYLGPDDSTAWTYLTAGA